MLDQPPIVAALAAKFLRYYVVAMPPMIVFECCRKFLGCQNIVRPFIWVCGFAVVVVHPYFLRFFLNDMQMGIEGAALAIASTNTVMCGLLFLHIRLNIPSEPKSKTWIFLFDDVHDPKSWGTPTLAQALEPRQARAFLKLGLSGVLSMTEWWYWEAIAFMAGRLGTASLAAHSIAYNVLPMAFMLPFGLSIGLTTRAGTLLGAKQPEMSITVTKWCMGLGSVVIGANALVVYCLGQQITESFTDDKLVIEQSALIWPWLCVHMLVDGFYGLVLGTMKALGLQFRLGVITIAVLWVIGLPVSIYYVFYLKTGIVGLWQITPAVYFSFDVVLSITCVLMSWQKISEEISTTAQ
eukprot:m.143558 g.143558  ORF g.143558 m.143558 type:complete len:352 (-) comp30322_c0_seq2:26-1081(-)